jgi:predicted Zn-dependent peptidase
MYEKLDEMIYKGTPYAEPVDTLRFHQGKHERDLLNRKRMLEFYRQYYVPENMMLSIVSSYSFSSVLNILSKTAFTRLRRGASAPIPPILNHHGDPLHPTQIIAPNIKKHSDYSLHSHSIPNITSTHIAIGFRTCNLYDKTTHSILHTLSTILGGTFMSRLFLVLREKHGLTYSSGTDVNYYENVGSFIIHATTDTAKLLRNGQHKGVLPVLMDLLKELVEKGITKKELEYVQHFLEGKIRMNTELSDRQCAYNAIEAFLCNKTNDTIVPYFRLYEDLYQHVTSDQVHEIIRKYFTRDNMFITIHGGKLPSETSVRKEIERFPLIGSSST